MRGLKSGGSMVDGVLSREERRTGKIARDKDQIT